MLVPLRILIFKWDAQCDMKKVKYFGGCTWEKYLGGSFFSYKTLSWEIYRIQRNGYHWRIGAQWKSPTTEEAVLNSIKYTRGSKLLLSIRRWKLSWHLSFKNGLEGILGNQAGIRFWFVLCSSINKHWWLW